PATLFLYTLSLHDALPISNFGFLPNELKDCVMKFFVQCFSFYIISVIVLILADQNIFNPDHTLSASVLFGLVLGIIASLLFGWRSEEHTSELQSRFDLVCR